MGGGKQRKRTFGGEMIEKKTLVEQKKEEIQDNSNVRYVLNLRNESAQWKSKFISGWNECEEQVRCKKPDEWDKKEPWQTKVYIPLQAKKSEVVDAYLGKMLFGHKRFFNIQGISKEDRTKDDALMNLYDVLLEKGKFGFHKDFVMQEAIDLGTSFLKILATPNRDGVSFVWRSVFNIWFDPDCGYDFYRTRYVIDEYEKDIADLIEDCKGSNPLYKKEKVAELLEFAQIAAASAKSKEDLSVIKGIDGTSDIVIHRDFLKITLLEYWGKVKVPITITAKDGRKREVYRWEDRIITIAQDRVELRNDPNEYGFIPYFICRVKPRKYDTYGKGYMLNSRGLQDLTNSMINLGFDSLKINSMDIIGVDVNKVSDFSSIEYRPLAVWKFKGSPREAMDRTRPSASALLDIVRGITLLDQIDQDASGVTRHAQGSPTLTGEGMSKETLGEYVSKLQMVDQRFLKVGRFIEVDFIEPLLKGIFRIITNPKLFTQEAADKILGFEEQKEKRINPLTGQEEEFVIARNSKLVLGSLGKEIDYNFKAVGMTRFISHIETLQKLQKMLELALSNPVLTMLTKVPEIWKRIWQVADVGDYQELLKSEDEIREIMNEIQAQGGA